MPHSNSDMIRRLQVALNSRGLRILCNRSQFYSEEQQRPITMYKISMAVFDENTGKHRHVELFSSASQIQIVLFMRNLWYAINGNPIPPTNQMKGSAIFEQHWRDFEESTLPSILDRM